ncbi:hypothetical protein BpHYR1_033987 [Brachionus plicatilis]|uniref:Uncharacterized protein n=1 Tax=Brachionus plicatilis TaxID=10195 RepID=A0A3M7R4F6_BRAPC|nr:hypothetical protein BpHYR1_033987 [Brachionus plicatilis]
MFLNDVIESPNEVPRASNQQRVRNYQNSDNRVLKGLVNSRQYQTNQDTSTSLQGEFFDSSFNICGLACDKRSMNMNPEILIEKLLIRKDTLRSSPKYVDQKLILVNNIGKLHFKIF